MNDISPRAEVSPKAVIGDNCKIYPFVYIEDDVVIGDNCIIYPYVSILNGTRMGSGNQYSNTPHWLLCRRTMSLRAKSRC